MKKNFLKLYDKLIIAAFMGIFSLSSCVIQKQTTQETANKEKDTTQKDSTNMKQNPNQVVAMYGVRVNKF